MNTLYLIVAVLILVAGLVQVATGAPKIDPQLSARLLTTPSTKELGVILTFNGQHVTDSQVNAVTRRPCSLSFLPGKNTQCRRLF